MPAEAAGAQVAARARALVGAPFRLHGRDPASGLDCVGLVALAIGAGGGAPVAYRLRMREIGPLLAQAAHCGLRPATGAVLPGDVLLLAVGPCQFHLAVAVEGGACVHAHAGLRRVVISPALPEGRRLRHWRLAPDA
ncbi:MAG TPA: hypothetical protein VFF98_03480 [Novosphingobium sp.]|nr:hypothetical protein [Novosphingobium sp.]